MLASVFGNLFGKKENTAAQAKARLSVIVAATAGTDSALVKELEERVKKVVHDFYIEKNLSDDEIENVSYSVNDETGVMEVQIPLQNGM